MTGTWVLVRHFLRLDRWMLLWWSIGITLLYWSQAVGVESLYTNQADFDRAAATMGSNAAFVAMAGPARALNTVGGQVTWQSTAFGAVSIGLMSMFLVVRHTRGEEENGRDELLRAASVGREATTAATVVVAVLANVLVGALVTLSLVTFPLAVPDSVALGVGLAATGLVFTGAALLAAQLASSARAAYGLTGVVIGTAYVLRAIGDVGTPVLTWLSPIGWYQGMHAFSGVRWWPLLPLVALAAVAVAAALVVFARRDHGSGVVADRAGPAHAGAALGTPLGLAWRLQRGAALGWAAGLFLTGVSYGSLGTDVGDLLGDSATSQEMFIPSGMSLVDGFYATAILMLAMMSSGYAITSALRPRHDERAGRLEALLATGLSRTRWLLTQVLLTTASTAVVLLAGGLGLGIGYAVTADDGGAVGRYLAATLPHVAPVLVLAGLTTLAYGARARWAGLAWLGLVLAVVVLLFGTVFQMPEWLQDLSPFHHLALVPAEDFRWPPLVVLVVVAVALTAAGVVAFTRRDVEVR